MLFDVQKRLKLQKIDVRENVTEMPKLMKTLKSYGSVFVIILHGNPSRFDRKEWDNFLR